MLRIRSLIVASALLLGACGTTPEDRTVSGAGIGAAGGAIIGAVTGLSVLQGAALGAVGGALTGVLSDPDKLDLGEPFWRRSSSPKSARGGASPVAATASRGLAPNSDLVAQIQTGLIERGYDPGPVDGIMGSQTARAIRVYQKDQGLLTDGRPSTELAAHIGVASN